jgi:hypothetical protein
MVKFFLQKCLYQFQWLYLLFLAILGNASMMANGGKAGNTKGGSITVRLTSYLTGLD